VSEVDCSCSGRRPSRSRYPLILSARPTQPSHLLVSYARECRTVAASTLRWRAGAAGLAGRGRDGEDGAVVDAHELESNLVDHPMVAMAEEHEVVDVGPAAVTPVHQVVPVNPQMYV
jgi:hypothetical protein